MRHVLINETVARSRAFALAVRLPVPGLGRTALTFARGWFVALALFASMSAAGQMGGVDVTSTLGELRGSHRYAAIASLVKRGQISSPLSAADGAAILQGTTSSARSASISQLAALFAADLNGVEAATILGDEATLVESHRFAAIAALARAGKFRADLTGDEMALVLNGTSRSARSASISVIAKSAQQYSSARPAASLPSAGARPSLGGSPAPSETAGTTPISRGVQPPAAAVGPVPGAAASGPTAGGAPVSNIAPGAATVLPLPVVSISDMRAMANAYQFAQISEAAYTTPGFVQAMTPNATVRWTRVRRLENYQNGFSAAVYVNEANTICAITFAGTNQLVDWTANAQQFLGWTPTQYRAAEQFAADAIGRHCVRASGLRMNVVLTGHSLGGGLAQYVYVRNMRTVRALLTFTFNTAGLAAGNPEFQLANLDATSVTNFIATPYDRVTGQRTGVEPVSLTGITIGREVRVPVYGSAATTHGIDAVRESLGVFRDRCRLDSRCRL